MGAAASEQLRKMWQQVVRVVAKKMLSVAEVPAFIPRDDLMDQLAQYAEIEAGANGARNFGLPMKASAAGGSARCDLPHDLPLLFAQVTRTFKDINGEQKLWGFTITLMRGGTHVCDIGFSFDDNIQVGQRGWHEAVSTCYRKPLPILICVDQARVAFEGQGWNAGSLGQADRGHRPQPRDLQVRREACQRGRQGPPLPRMVLSVRLASPAGPYASCRLQIVIKRLCVAMSEAVNKYYTFGSVYSEEL